MVRFIDVLFGVFIVQFRNVFGYVDMQFYAVPLLPQDTTSHGKLKLKCSLNWNDTEILTNVKISEEAGSSSKHLGVLKPRDSKVSSNDLGVYNVVATGEARESHAVLEVVVSGPPSDDVTPYTCGALYSTTSRSHTEERKTVSARVPDNLLRKLYRDIDREKHELLDNYLEVKTRAMSLERMSSEIGELNCTQGDTPYFRPKIEDVCVKIDRGERSISVKRSDGVRVVCSGQSDGGRWTVIQRRTNGNVTFERDWESYVTGFGDTPGGDFWWGLDHIHKLTRQDRFELRIDMVYNGTQYHATYQHFQVLNASTHFQLLVFGYNGTAGDSLYYHNGMPFSTADQDNDYCSCNCAAVYSGAWWYNACHRSNLNGVWHNPGPGGGVNWFMLTALDSSLSSVEMKIRQWTDANSKD